MLLNFSFLLKTIAPTNVQQQQNLDIVNNQAFQFNIGIAHQALLQNNGPTLNHPYIKPSYFKLRVISNNLRINIACFFNFILQKDCFIISYNLC